MKNNKRFGIIAAIAVTALLLLAQCFSIHDNANGTSMMVEVSGKALEKATGKEYDEIMSHCCQVMENRIQLFCEEEPGLGKAKYSIKRVNDEGRIRIDFTNKELSQEQVARVLRLLQSHGCLQFYETYQFNELCDCFIKADEKLAEKNDSLFRLLQPNFEQIAPGKMSPKWNACVGIAQTNDTADINQMLIETSDCFPPNLKFAWTAKPIVMDENEVLELIALKLSHDNKCALSGEAITNARQEYNSYYNHAPEILLVMNNEDSKAWKRITGDNIGRQIAIVFDGYVYSYPFVNCEIPNGRASISGGNLTVETAKDLANILKAGMLPVSVSVNVIE